VKSARRELSDSTFGRDPRLASQSSLIAAQGFEGGCSPIEGLDVIRVLAKSVVTVCHDPVVLWRRHVHVTCERNKHGVVDQGRRRTCCSIAVKHSLWSWRHRDGLCVEVDGLVEFACLVEGVAPCLEGRSLFYAFL
jgi:hypothetical protein